MQELRKKMNVDGKLVLSKMDLICNINSLSEEVRIIFIILFDEEIKVLPDVTVVKDNLDLIP